METLASRKIREFFSSYRHISYKKGQIFLHPDDEPQGIYYLAEGYAKLYSISEDGREITLIIFMPEDVFPLIWAINNSKNLYYLEALTPVKIWCAPKERFLEFIENNSDALFELTRRLLVRVTGLLKRMEYLVFGNAYNKVASIILICAQRFGRKRAEDVFIQVPLTHKNIANLLGISRETASIEMKKLERKGLISYQGRYLVVRSESLIKKEALLD